MRLNKLCVKGFRSLKDIELDIDALTVIIGENDAGKSSLLNILDLVLNDGRPDNDDYYQEGENKADKIEVILEFAIEEDDLINQRFARNNLLIIQKVFTPTSSELFYLGEIPKDKRFTQDFQKLKAAEQIDLIRSIDVEALENLKNQESRNKWLVELANKSPKIESWISISPRAILLPRFERYSAIDYKAPENIVFKTLKLVYEEIIFEESEIDGLVKKQPIAPLREIINQANTRIQQEIDDLGTHIRTYNDRIKNIKYEPQIDFTNGLRGGDFQVDDGRGFRFLNKSGDGVKRRMLIAALDWDRKVALRQAAEDTNIRPVIRGYDEPDTNLHYDAQRKMYRSIHDVVHVDNSKIQAIVCTHSLTMIDRAPAQSIRSFSLVDTGFTKITRLDTDSDPDVERFLSEVARELGITNTIMFYEKSYILIEGETEEMALPIFYRHIYKRSMLEDGIRILPVRGSGAIKEFLKLLVRNRKEITFVFVDSDCDDNNEAQLTRKVLKNSGFDDAFIANHIILIGDKEYEDSFPDEILVGCFETHWSKKDGKWKSQDILDIRSSKKFSKALTNLIWEQSEVSVNKQTLGQYLARHCCDCDHIPQEIKDLFERARKVAQIEE